MFFRFAAEVPLRWVDVDSAGVVNNAAFLSMMEQGRWLYFRELGLLAGHEVPFVLAETTVKFQRPGRMGQKVEVAARVRSLGTTSFRMDYEVRGDDDVLVTAEAALVFVDAALKPVPIPEAWRAAITQFEELG